MVPSFFVPCCSGILLIGLIVNKDCYVKTSRLHVWTVRRAVAGMVGSWFGSCEVLHKCTSDLDVRFIANILFAIFAILSGFVLACFPWLCSLHVRGLAEIAPRASRVSMALMRLGLYTFAVAGFVYALTRVYQRKVLMLIYFGLEVLYVVINLPVYIIFTLLLELSARSALREAFRDDINKESAIAFFQAAMWARGKAILFATASASHIFFVTADIAADTMPGFLTTLLLRIGFAFALVINVALSAALCGMFDKGSVRDSLNLHVAASSIAAQRRRQIEHALRGSIGNSAASAATIASLMLGASPDAVLTDATDRFRCVSWSVLARRPDIITGGATLDVIGPGGDDLYLLSEPCQLGQCDAFFSHSWRDNGVLKWKALEAWCVAFAREHGRSPRLWLDKVCLRQTDIERDLRCLPIFLAGCNSMFITSGATYPSRLWCAMEMLVYKAMFFADASRSAPVVCFLGETDGEREMQLQAWLNFNVDNCECFNLEDKKCFLRVVSMYPDGSDGFNRFIREQALSLTPPVSARPSLSKTATRTTSADASMASSKTAAPTCSHDSSTASSSKSTPSAEHVHDWTSLSGQRIRVLVWIRGTVMSNLSTERRNMASRLSLFPSSWSTRKNNESGSSSRGFGLMRWFRRKRRTRSEEDLSAPRGEDSVVVPRASTAPPGLLSRTNEPGTSSQEVQTLASIESLVAVNRASICPLRSSPCDPATTELQNSVSKSSSASCVQATEEMRKSQSVESAVVVNRVTTSPPATVVPQAVTPAAEAAQPPAAPTAVQALVYCDADDGSTEFI
eukprot:TRINITY_DN16779_c0_g1_i1.p1 TRINITY_DN16779_c0_g1~~TRINITY_DN16779_c0_g1_i1.p1  ORF type:complete len:889 (-),score=103.54 TRINITY_DN16779_c0_g1_i1:230-2617(-)